MPTTRAIPLAIGLLSIAASTIGVTAHASSYERTERPGPSKSQHGAQDAKLVRPDTVSAPAAARLAPDPCKLVTASPDNFITRVPFDVVDGRIYVTGRINNQGPFRLAVDTGASGIGRADTKLVQALGLTNKGKANNSDGLHTAVVDTVLLDSVELGGLARKNVDVITRDYASRLPAAAGFDGILAREFFADGLLILDYPRKSLSFSRTLSLNAGEHVLSYERAFRVPVKIVNTRLEANLDTGANVALVMPPALYEKVADGPLQLAGAADLTNTRIATQRAIVRGPVELGGVKVSDVEVRVAERFPEVLVGAHILQQYAIIIDQRSKRVAMCR